MEQFTINGEGKCTSCSQVCSKSEILCCCSCESSFHAVCSSVDKKEYLCTTSYLKMYYSSTSKSNFKWFCDSCLTTFEVSKTATVDDRIGHLTSQVSKMVSNMNELNQTVASLQQNQLQDGKHNNDDFPQPAWVDPNRTQAVKSSLLIKPTAGTTTSLSNDLGKIRDIAVNNNIQVRNVGISKSGNTFIHCSSTADRNKLQPLLSDNYQGREIIPLKENLPHITINGIIQVDDEDITGDKVLRQICNQNPVIADLKESGEELKVLFVRKQITSKTIMAVVKVGTKIRDAIKHNGNRLFIGISSCRVFDRFFVKRCNKCQSFGHYKDQCKGHAVCGYCAESHCSEDCPIKDSKDCSLLKCHNCKENGLDYIGHSTFWPKCPSYLLAQKKLRSTIPYYDSQRKTLNG